MKRSWIKLYVEILDDEKLADLPDSVCWRFVQLLLTAAERDEGGILPAVKKLAWRLRLDQGQLLDDLRALSEVGVIVREGENWKVTNFEKRQAAMSEAERSSRYRHGRRHESVTEYVTESDGAPVTDSSSTSTSPSVSESVGVRVQGEGWERVRRCYEQDIGAMTPMLADALVTDMREYGADWVCAALEEAVRSEARNLKYAEAILLRWKREGFKSRNGNGSKPASKTRQEIIEEVANRV